MKRISIPAKLLGLIQISMEESRGAVMMTQEATTEEFVMNNELRQGGILSITLFNI